MRNITTEAWVLYQGAENGNSRKAEPARLKREPFSFADISEQEVLAEPLYGCWEANMTHALERRPIDICRDRREEKVVIGNAGVVRILRTGRSVTSVAPGDLCLVFCNGIWDRLGYPKKILAYDAPNSIGMLARQTKLHEKQIIRIPENSRHSLQQWAAFSLRYITAWANWKQAYGCWRLQFGEDEQAATYVWGWGGGVSLAQLTLAKHFGCTAAMCTSMDERLLAIKQLGVEPVDRRRFINLNFDEKKYLSDAEFRKAYQDAEETFLEITRESTRGEGVSIFIDYIGSPVFRASLKALTRQGVITTAGWKQGMKTSSVRAVECMNWHIHVHTHYARYGQGLEAVRFAEEKGWMPSLDGEQYAWDDIPELAEEYLSGRVNSYFPIFEVNPA